MGRTYPPYDPWSAPVHRVDERAAELLCESYARWIGSMT